MEINVMFSLRQLSLCWSWSGWNPRPVFFSFLILCFWKLSRLPHFFFASNQKTPLLQSVHFTIHRGACGGSGGGGSRKVALLLIGRDYFQKWKWKTTSWVEEVTHPLPNTPNRMAAGRCHGYPSPRRCKTRGVFQTPGTLRVQFMAKCRIVKVSSLSPHLISLCHYFKIWEAIQRHLFFNEIQSDVTQSLLSLSYWETTRNITSPHWERTWFLLFC